MTPSLDKATAYCDCWKKHLHVPTPWDQIDLCRCGEDHEVREWSWERDERNTSALVVSEDSHQVTFHPYHSSGTALAKGDKPLLPNQHYYWEIKMLTEPYGTDVVVGVGTNKVNVIEYQTVYTSLLGENCESYGLSYTGAVSHDGKKAHDTLGFTKGSIIGVRLNLWLGTLEFYVNRKPIGAIFYNLRRHETLFPMLASTAAQSSMRLIYAASWPASLLVDSAMILATYIHDKADEGERQCVKLPPGLWSKLRQQFWLTLPLEDNFQEFVFPHNIDEDMTQSARNLLSPFFTSSYCNGFYLDSIPPESRVVVLP